MQTVTADCSWTATLLIALWAITLHRSPRCKRSLPITTVRFRSIIAMSSYWVSSALPALQLSELGRLAKIRKSRVRILCRQFWGTESTQQLTSSKLMWCAASRILCLVLQMTQTPLSTSAAAVMAVAAITVIAITQILQVHLKIQSSHTISAWAWARLWLLIKDQACRGKKQVLSAGPPYLRLPIMSVMLPRSGPTLRQ